MCNPEVTTRSKCKPHISSSLVPGVHGCRAQCSVATARVGLLPCRHLVRHAAQHLHQAQHLLRGVSCMADQHRQQLRDGGSGALPRENCATAAAATAMSTSSIHMAGVLCCSHSFEADLPGALHTWLTAFTAPLYNLAHEAHAVQLKALDKSKCCCLKHGCEASRRALLRVPS